MPEDFDPSALAAAATGETTSTADPDPSPDGSEPSPDGDPRSPESEEEARSVISALRERLFATEPSPPLESDELSTWDEENGGMRRVKRGFYKFSGAEGATAIEDIVLGLWEASTSGSSTTSSDQEATDADDSGDREIDAEGDPLADSGVPGA